MQPKNAFNVTDITNLCTKNNKGARWEKVLFHNRWGIRPRVWYYRAGSDKIWHHVWYLSHGPCSTFQTNVHLENGNNFETFKLFKNKIIFRTFETQNPHISRLLNLQKKNTISYLSKYLQVLQVRKLITNNKLTYKNTTFTDIVYMKC